MSTFTVQHIRRREKLRPVVPAWRMLAGGVPFREPSWLVTWWEVYGASGLGDFGSRELCVLVVREQAEIIGIAPWYVEPSPLGGRVIKQLGSGEVCTDYQTLLAAPGREQAVAAAVAQFLLGDMHGDWDRLDLDGVVVGDVVLASLIENLEADVAAVERRPGPSCWRLALPPTFDDYLALCSKSHRKQLRRLQRDVLDTPQARWHTADTIEDFVEAWPIFVDLHQRRRRSLGEPGCFRSRRFTAFHERVAVSLLVRGALRLHWLEYEGRPLAAEYHIGAGRSVYAYQSGVDPERLDLEPGRLAGIAVIQQAIREGYQTYDLLRGDEPYKAHWRAVPTATEQISIVNPRPTSRARHAVHHLLRRAKHAVFRGPASSQPAVATLAPGEPPGAHDAEPSITPALETAQPSHRDVTK
jgi:CelD/BcsL family acetyltransferase involved in cellulose biosynthesis